MEPASVGIYYFDNFEFFLNNAKKLNNKKNLHINNELYVSQIYLEFIKQKKIF